MPRHVVIPPQRASDQLELLLGVDQGPLVSEAASGTSLPDVVESPTLVYTRGTGPAEWLNGDDCRVLARPRSQMMGGETFGCFRTPAGEVLECTDGGDGRVCLPFSLAEAYENYVFERWTESQASRWITPAQLNAYYRVKRLIPRRVQLAARRGLIAFKGRPDFPHWPHDDAVERLVRFYGTCVLRAMRASRLPFRWFWPNGMHAAAILTHDIEGTSGMRNAIRVAELEEARGFRSSFNIVADWYPIDWGIINELRARGHEIGSHALYHDRSLFSSREEFEHQLPLLREAVGRLGAVGFRSPATHRVPEWLDELPIDYDTTIPLSDPYEAQPGGACSSWPFFIGDLVELPYTLPQDHTLLTLMRHGNADLWVDQMRRVKRSYGLIQCLSHPDDGYLADKKHESIYCEFLDALSEETDLWHALPRDVANWWRARAAGQNLPALNLSHGTIVLQQDTTLAELRPPD